MKWNNILSLLLVLSLFFGCSEENKTSQTAANVPPQNDPVAPEQNQPEPQDPIDQQEITEPQMPADQQEGMLYAAIDNVPVTIQWEENDSVKALHELVKGSDITIDMSQYGGFEQVGSLGQSLPKNDVQTTTAPGDIVLYSGNQIVVFYGSNSWDYTRLGKISDKSETELKALLDKENVTMKISSKNIQSEPLSSDKKLLVAYFSVTKHTKSIAEYISEYTGATLYEIVSETPYTDADINYGDKSSRTSLEQNDPNARPAIASTIEDIEQYDIIYLGYPIWWGEAPKIMYTFLEGAQIKVSTTIIPFCTSASSGMGTSATNLKEAAPSLNWLEGRRFAIGAEKSAVTEWIDSLNL